jgi:hypothetical protein
VDKVVHAVSLEGRNSALCRQVIHSLSDMNFCSQMKKLIKTPIIETNTAGSCLWSAEQILISDAILNLNHNGSEAGQLNEWLCIFYKIKRLRYEQEHRRAFLSI